jgi:hypothetical protein
VLICLQGQLAGEHSTGTAGCECVHTNKEIGLDVGMCCMTAATPAFM